MDQLFLSEPLENSLLFIVPLTDYQAGLLIADPDFKKRFMDESVEAMQIHRRVNHLPL